MRKTPTRDSFPRVNPALLEALERKYPDKLPTNRGVTLSEVNVLQGQQDVITYLRRISKEQKA